MTVMAPVRVQRQRTRHWRMPANTVYVGRPTQWGNQYRVLNGNHDVAVAQFRVWLLSDAEIPTALRRQAQRKLAGKNLACWCPPHQACHADVWLMVANESGPTQCTTATA